MYDLSQSSTKKVCHLCSYAIQLLINLLQAFKYIHTYICMQCCMQQPYLGPNHMSFQSPNSSTLFIPANRMENSIKNKQTRSSAFRLLPVCNCCCDLVCDCDYCLPIIAVCPAARAATYARRIIIITTSALDLNNCHNHS